MSLLFRLIRNKLDTLETQLRRDDLAPLDRGIIVAQRTLAGLGLARSFDVRRHKILELQAPPVVARGFRDLLIRTASVSDAEAIGAVKGTDPALIAARLRQGDLAYVGILEDRVLCHVFFHRGPAPFVEDEPTMGRWALGADTFWSFDAATTPDSRSSGIFVKVFQTALAALFAEQGAQRILCRVDIAHRPSIALHHHLGFRTRGRILTAASPAANLVSWLGPAPRTWVLRRGCRTAIALPPS